MSKATTFQANTQVGGKYLWSTSSNWSNGVPTSGDAVTANSGTGSVDDIGSLSLASLDLGGKSGVDVVANSLTIGVLYGGELSRGVHSDLIADAVAAGAPVTVTIANVASGGGILEANGAGARLIDNSATDVGCQFLAANGGFIELMATPYYGFAELNTTFRYYGAGTIALANPGSIIPNWFLNVGGGDSIELPGSSVSNIVMGTNTLSVTTNVGTYNGTFFFLSGVNGWFSSFDAQTGLVKITFYGQDTFARTSPQSGGLLNGLYLWSNASNWSGGLVATGDSVSQSTQGYDDIANLSLTALTLGAQGDIPVVGNSLSIGTVAGAAGSYLGAAAQVLGSPVTVTVGTITGSGATYYANGAGAKFIDNSSSDSGNRYYAVNGGYFASQAAPNAGSDFEFSGVGTFAFATPASIAAKLGGVGVGDTIEVVGASVQSVSLSSSSINIVTDAGTYEFTNVSYAGAVTGYSVSTDAQTGFQAITLQGQFTFSQATPQGSGPIAGHYLWSNAANWSAGALPTNNATVSISSQGYDDISALSLATLNLSVGADVPVVAGSLSVGTVVGALGVYLGAAAQVLGSPVAVTVGAITGSGGIYYAYGVGATFTDNSSTDTGNLYFAGGGGVFNLAAAPGNQSVLQFYGPGAFILPNAGSALGCALTGVGDSDVLELAGTSAATVTFGANSLHIAAGANSYDFSNVSYSGSGIGYAAWADSATGLQRITFCNGSWQNAAVSNQTINIERANVNVIGGNDNIVIHGGGSIVELYNDYGYTDAVIGSDSIVALNNSSATVTGGGDIIDFVSSSSFHSQATLYNTGGNWDTLKGTAIDAKLNNVQANVIGGAATIRFASGTNVVELYGTGGNWDQVYQANGGGNNTVALNGAEANIFGGGVTIDLVGAYGNIVELYGTSGVADSVFGSSGVIALNSAQAVVTGGADAILFASGSGNHAELSGTSGQWDYVYGSNGAVGLAGAQANVIGGGNAIYFDSGSQNVAALYQTGNNWDQVTGSGGTIALYGAQANIIGGGNVVELAGGSNNVAELYNTNGNWDHVNGSNGIVVLNGVQADVTGDGVTIDMLGAAGNTLGLYGDSEFVALAAHFGVSGIAGFNSTDIISFSGGDFGGWQALQGAMSQQGADTLITLDANDTLRLYNTQMSNLTASQFHFG